MRLLRTYTKLRECLCVNLTTTKKLVGANRSTPIDAKKGLVLQKATNEAPKALMAFCCGDIRPILSLKLGTH